MYEFLKTKCADSKHCLQNEKYKSSDTFIEKNKNPQKHYCH